MKAILILLLVSFFASCNMQKYCSSRFPPTASTNDSISFIEKVVYRDTTIYLTMKGETVFDTVYIDTVSNTAQSYLSTDFSKSFAFWDGQRLIHELMQKDSSIALALSNAIKEHSTISYIEREVVKVEVRNELTGWQHSQIYAAWILAIILLVSALWRKLPSALVSKVMQVFKKKKPP